MLTTEDEILSSKQKEMKKKTTLVNRKEETKIHQIITK